MWSQEFFEFTLRSHDECTGGHYIKEITLNWESGNTGEFGVIATESNCPQVVHRSNRFPAESANYLIPLFLTWWKTIVEQYLIRNKLLHSRPAVNIEQLNTRNANVILSVHSHPTSTNVLFRISSKFQAHMWLRPSPLTRQNLVPRFC